jgi:hypothetical protein
MAYKDTFSGSKHSREEIEKHFGKELTERNLGKSPKAKSEALKRKKEDKGFNAFGHHYSKSQIDKVNKKQGFPIKGDYTK